MEHLFVAWDFGEVARSWSDPTEFGLMSRFGVVDEWLKRLT